MFWNRKRGFRTEVANQLGQGRLWPEPLIQFNPAYLNATPLHSMVDEDVLQKEVGEVFSGFG
jgi:hypothetical protein